MFIFHFKTVFCQNRRSHLHIRVEHFIEKRDSTLLQSGISFSKQLFY